MSSQERRAEKVRVDLPPASELLAMSESGIPIDEIGRRFGCSGSIITQRISDSGLRSTRRKREERRKHRAELRSSSEANNWQWSAACVGMHKPDIFFDQYRYGEAVAVCDECPVRDACLREAMRAEGSLTPSYRHGVLGGLLPIERHHLHLERMRIDRGDAA